MLLAWLTALHGAAPDAAASEPAASPALTDVAGILDPPGPPEVELAPTLRQLERVDRIAVRPWRDVPLLAAGLASSVLLESYQSELSAEGCRWCEGTRGGSLGVNPVDAAFRDALRWSDTERADRLSDVTGRLMVPTAAFGLTALAAWREGRLRQAPYDALLIVESALITSSVTTLVKIVASRERPYRHALASSDPKRLEDGGNGSFYSGHTSGAFVLAVSAGTVASLRGYRWAPLVWAVGVPLAATTGYLRIAADKHYFTDVAVGAAVGSAIGFAVPYLLHRKGSGRGPLRRLESIAPMPVKGGGALSLQWRW